MSFGLTPKQATVLQALRDLTKDGVSPSFDEIMAHTGICSRGTVHQAMGRLEDRGVIRRKPHQARAIQIVDQDPLDGMGPDELVALRDAIDARLAVAA